MPRENSQLFSISDQPEDSKFIPLYDVPNVVYEDKEESEQKFKEARASKNSCWNCGDKTHTLRQCTQPINHEEIKKNRQSFSAHSEFKRYHVGTKEDKFLHLKPGVISDNLREALGLEANQLPEYIYRMRSLGYPPGWLLEAKCDTSGIEMFDADGNRVPNADEEEGETGNTNSLYNEDKILTFPGFNTWPTTGTIDETRRYNAPKLNRLPSKEDFIRQLNENPLSTSISKTKPVIINDRRIYYDDIDTEEVNKDIHLLPKEDTCAFIPPLPSELPPPPPPGEPLNDIKTVTTQKNVKDYEEKFYNALNSIKNILSSDSIKIKTKRIITKNIDDMENVFTELIAMSNNLNKKIVVDETFKSEMTVANDEEMKNELQKEAEKTADLEETQCNEENEEVSVSNHGRVMHVEFGTPVIKMHSPYQKLPSADKFKKDISDVINFENLPNSVGKYHQLKKVLSSVRMKKSYRNESKLNMTI